MKLESLFSGKYIKKNIFNLLSAESAQIVVNVKNKSFSVLIVQVYMSLVDFILLLVLIPSFIIFYLTGKRTTVRHLYFAVSLFWSCKQSSQKQPNLNLANIQFSVNVYSIAYI